MQDVREQDWGGRLRAILRKRDARGQRARLGRRIKSSIREEGCVRSESEGEEDQEQDQGRGSVAKLGKTDERGQKQDGGGGLRAGSGSGIQEIRERERRGRLRANRGGGSRAGLGKRIESSNKEEGRRRVPTGVQGCRLCVRCSRSGRQHKTLGVNGLPNIYIKQHEHWSQ